MEERKQEKDYIASYRTIITIIGVAIFVLGFILGGTFPITTLKETYQNTTLPLKDYMYDTEINWVIALITWGSGILFIILLNILKDILYELRKANDK